MTKTKFLFLRNGYLKYCIITLLFFISIGALGQSQKGILKGKVIDGSTFRALYGVTVSLQKTPLSTAQTAADGCYFLNIDSAGTYAASYKLDGFQNKIIKDIKIQNGQIAYLDIILNPLAQSSETISKKLPSIDSVPAADSVLRNTFLAETSLTKYNPAFDRDILSGDIIAQKNIRFGTEKNTLFLLKRLNGVVVLDNPASPLVNSFCISGMGERYNQLIFNGAVSNNFGPLSRSSPLQLMPSEAIDEVSVEQTGNSTMPSDYAGGTVGIKTKDYTDRDFFYILGGIGLSQGTMGQDMYGDKKNTSSFFGLSGAQRNLPNEFPTTKSEYNFNSKNIQEQVYLSRLLQNNIAPVNNGSQKPNEKFMLGFGKLFKLKNGTKISLLGFLNQSAGNQFNSAIRQVAPNVAGNPYPFSEPGKSVVFSQSGDSTYLYASQFGGVLNASVVYGRNKISLRNFFGSQLTESYTKKRGLYKPDEDALAHAGISYATTQNNFINTQLSGEHALDANGKFKMDWQATYSYLKQQNPDERNFLLRENLANENFEIATPNTNNSFTNSSRRWSSFTDHYFSGGFNLSFPFNLFHQPQAFAGGIYLQQNSRVFNSDLLLFQGTGYTPLDKLLAPERYFPGGVTANNFYSNVADFYDANNQVIPSLVKPYSRANYTASSNTGAAFVQLNTRLTNSVSLNFGGRMESNSQLVSNIYYRFVDGFRYPQVLPLDQNTNITTYNFLPSANLAYSPSGKVKIYASYFATVNRPQLQELVKYSQYNAAAFAVTTGNPLIASTTIDNFNGGVDFLPNAFSSISVSAFYKKINQPIEYIVSSYGIGNMLFTPHNTPSATVQGVSAAFKLNLNVLNKPWLSGITVFANGNLVKSTADAGPVRSMTTSEVTEHNLSGTPDYSFNTGIIIQQPHLPEITLLYSGTGDYITALGSGKVYTLANGNTVSATPDYWVKGLGQLDIQVSQLFISKLRITYGINNILAKPYIEYQDLNGNKKFDTPLTVNNSGGAGGGYYVSGTDNSILNITQQRSFYLTLSYLFK